MHLVLGGVPSPGDVPGPGGVYLVLGGVPGPGGCTWSWGVDLVLGGVPGPRGGGCLPGTPPRPDQVHPLGTKHTPPPMWTDRHL